MGLPLEWEAVARTKGLLSFDGRGSALVPTFRTEAEFQAAVIKLARANGWLAYHTHNSRRSELGFPDCVFVRERLIVAELKTDTGKLANAQEAWIEGFRRAGVTAFVWRPAGWKDIERVLE